MQRSNPVLVEVNSMTIGMTSHSSALWREAARLRGRKTRRVFQIEDFLLTARLLARLNSSSVGNHLLQLPPGDAKAFLAASIFQNAGVAADAITKAVREPLEKLAFVHAIVGASPR